ncbi:MAG TPA: SAM-dependent methyltransferase, partial [Thermoanaerobaculia bacterium]|nr:SAM-dependent methyltransferase [Thermoanaerobaculia bacterium]
LITAWRLPGARFTTIEAQEISIRLARKSVRYNGVEDRFTLIHGDLRVVAGDLARHGAAGEGDLHADTFDLVTGSPPYWPPGTASEAEHEQAVPARIEIRGSVADYAQTAARILAPGGTFVFVFPTAQLDRAISALRDAQLALVRRRDVIFKEGEPPLITLFAATRAGEIPSTYRPFVEPPLIIRRRDGGVPDEYSAIRMSFGFPPGNVP